MSAATRRPWEEQARVPSAHKGSRERHTPPRASREGNARSLLGPGAYDTKPPARAVKNPSPQSRDPHRGGIGRAPLWSPLSLLAAARGAGAVPKDAPPEATGAAYLREVSRLHLGPHLA